MNMVLMWLIIGTVIGIIANLLEIPFSSKTLGMSIMLGVVGASIGGLTGELLSHASNGIYISPLLYIVMGSMLSALVPSRSNIL